jgi:hypothetical protein
METGSDLVKMSADHQTSTSLKAGGDDTGQILPIRLGYLLETDNWYHCISFRSDTGNKFLKSKLSSSSFDGNEPRDSAYSVKVLSKALNDGILATVMSNR